LSLLHSHVLGRSDEDEDVSHVDEAITEDIAEKLDYSHSPVYVLLPIARGESRLESLQSEEASIEHLEALEIQNQAHDRHDFLHLREILDPGSKLFIFGQDVPAVVEVEDDVGGDHESQAEHRADHDLPLTYDSG